MTRPLSSERFRLTLKDKREIELAVLHQRLTYVTLLVGHPTRSINRSIMQSDLRMAEERQYRPTLSLMSVLLEPTITPIPSRLRLGGSEEDILNPYEALPPILSVAVFDSDAIGSIEACSSALVVWYQDQWGLPTPPTIEALQTLDWVKNSHDWTW